MPPESVRELTMFVEAVCNARKVSAVTETQQPEDSWLTYQINDGLFRIAELVL